jgi:hypothetical protein
MLLVWCLACIYVCWQSLVVWRLPRNWTWTCVCPTAAKVHRMQQKFPRENLSGHKGKGLYSVMLIAKLYCCKIKSTYQLNPWLHKNVPTRLWADPHKRFLLVCKVISFEMFLALYIFKQVEDVCFTHFFFYIHCTDLTPICCEIFHSLFESTISSGSFVFYWHILLTFTVELSLFVGDPCLWILWTTLTHKFTSPRTCFYFLCDLHKHYPY